MVGSAREGHWMSQECKGRSSQEWQGNIKEIKAWKCKAREESSRQVNTEDGMQGNARQGRSSRQGKKIVGLPRQGREREKYKQKLLTDKSGQK